MLVIRLNKSGVKGMKWGQLKFSGKVRSKETRHFMDALKKVAQKYGKQPISDEQITDVYREYIRNKFNDHDDDLMPPHRVKMFKKGDVKLVVLTKSEKGEREEMRNVTRGGKTFQRRTRVGKKKHFLFGAKRRVHRKPGKKLSAKEKQLRIKRLERAIAYFEKKARLQKKGINEYNIKYSENRSKRLVRLYLKSASNLKRKLAKLTGKSAPKTEGFIDGVARKCSDVSKALRPLGWKITSKESTPGAHKIWMEGGESSINKVPAVLKKLGLKKDVDTLFGDTTFSNNHMQIKFKHDEIDDNIQIFIARYRKGKAGNAYRRGIDT